MKAAGTSSGSLDWLWFWFSFNNLTVCVSKTTIAHAAVARFHPCNRLPPAATPYYTTWQATPCIILL